MTEHSDNDLAALVRVTSERMAQKTSTAEDRIIHGLASEVTNWRRLYLDQPEDRLWHDKDGTWWKRDDSHYTGIGSLVRATPPAQVAAMTESLRREIAQLCSKISSFTTDRLRHNELWSKMSRVQSETAAYLSSELLRFQEIARLVCFHPVNRDTCGVCGEHFWECDKDTVFVGDETSPAEPACAGGKARVALEKSTDKKASVA